ncbi:MAG: DUF2130 domain-containing protein [Elusimicrobia bacterium]|nr:DUF2130 domain-containing protein [Elusimicrobiota bacterium]MBK8651448.1 DUF2130 domain-containing protein [Elusimicrobiota bacterium]
MKTYKCPTCGKVLTRAEYEKALKIQGATEKHFHQREEALREKAQEREARFRKKERELQDRLKNESARIRRIEKARAERSNLGLKQSLQKANEEIRRLRTGTTPQTDGLEFEEKLVIRLRAEFPDDEVLHKGQGGDVLHTVKFGKEIAGIIVYECKRTPRIEGDHIAQAHQAKQIRQADFVVLVTTARKKGFTGFTQMNGVWIAAPLASIPLAALLRQHLIEMVKARITKEKRAAIAQQLMKFIDSPQFRNPVEEVVQRTTRLQEMIKKEAKDHFRIWRDRWEHYQTIHWNATQVQANLQLVLHGNAPKPMHHHKATPLQLP